MKIGNEEGKLENIYVENFKQMTDKNKNPPGTNKPP